MNGFLIAFLAVTGTEMGRAGCGVMMFYVRSSHVSSMQFVILC
jgi:hypothetical protein